jgi:hypothetical protein
MPVLGNARPHCTIEVLQRIIADAGVGIWRDVGRIDHAHGRSHAQAPGKGLAAPHGMASNAVAGAGEILAFVSVRRSLLCVRGRARAEDQERDSKKLHLAHETAR